MATLTAIRELTVRGRSVGLDKLRSDLAAVKAEHLGLAQAAGQAGSATDAASRQQDAAQARWAKQQSRVDAVAKAYLRFEQDLQRAVRAIDNGTISADAAAREIERMQRALEAAGAVNLPALDQSGLHASLGVMVDDVRGAARESAAAFEAEFARLDDIARQRTEASGRAFREAFERSVGIGAPSAVSGGATYSALEEQERQDEYRRQHIASLTKIGIEERLGIGREAPSARASASVFEEQAREAEEAARRINAAAEYAAAGWTRMGRSQLDAANPGVVRLNANAAAEDKLRNMGRAAAEAGKSAGLAGHQWTNLSFQINDAATMALSGAGAFQILATQGGQVFQILQSGPKGAFGSLKEIGSAALGLLSPLNLVLAGLVAIPAAIAFLGRSGRRDVETIDDAFKRHAETIRSVKELYGEAAASLRETARESESVLRAMAQINLVRLREQAHEQGKSVMQSLGGVAEQPMYDPLGNALGTSGVSDFRVNPRYAALRTEIEELYRSYEAGTPKVQEFMDALSRQMSDPLKDDEYKKRIDEVIKLTEGWKNSLDRIPEALRAIGVTAESAAAALARVRTDRFDLANREIWARTPEERGQVAYDRRLLEVRDDDRFDPDAKNLEADRARSLELERIRRGSVDAERQAAASYGFDMREITARTVDQRAAIAADRARASALEDVSRAANADAEAQRASARVYAEARQEAVDYAAEQAEAARQRLAAADLEVASIGKTAAETERLRFVMEQTNEARQRAFQLTGDYNAVSAQTVAAINREAAALAARGNASRKARLEEDLQHEREAVFLGEREAAYRSTIRGAGFDPDSAFGRAKIEIMRTTDALKEMRDVGKSAWETLGEGLRSGQGLGKSLAGAGRKLLDDAAKKSWDALYDQAWSAIGDATGIKGLGGARDGKSANSALFVEVVNGGPLGSAGAGGALSDVIAKGLGGGRDVTRAPLGAPAANDNGVNARVAQAFDAGGWLKYANQGATRSQPLDPKLVNAFSFLQERGISMNVFSGGQPGIGEGGPRVGSTRHDHGNAADVFFSQDGRRLDWRNPADVPVFQDIVREARARGVTGFGAGPGYMQPGSMHVGYGAPGVWGAGGRGANAPDWLREAYNTPANPSAIRLDEIKVNAAADNLDKLSKSAADSAGRVGDFGEGIGKASMSMSDLFGGIGGMAGMALGGKKGGALGGILGTLGGKLLGTLLGGAGGGAAGGLGIFGTLLGFDEGGWTGAAARHQIAGVVHGQEFVVNAAATSQHRGLLEAINDGRLPGFAEGGYVGNDNYPAAGNDNGWSRVRAIPAPPPPPQGFGGGELTIRVETNDKAFSAKIAKTSLPIARRESAHSGAQAVDVTRKNYGAIRAREQRHGHTN